MHRFARSGGIRSASVVLLLIGGLALTGPAVAQTGGGPINGGPLPPGGGTLGVTVPDVQVAPGETFTLSVELDESTPLDTLIMFINTDPAGVQFLAWTPGAGLASYQATNGTPPQCDVMVDPMSFMGFMFFVPPYESSIYGTGIYDITCVANGPAGTYTLDWFADAMFDGAGGTTTVTVGEPEPAMMRGDVNNDGDCNITDAVNLLGHLFAGNFDPNCADAADIDDDGAVNLADAVNLLSGLFLGGFVLDDSCQEDATLDGLTPCDRDACQ